jgi:DNA (cytosine-5)-methyltransferase 1
VNVGSLFAGIGGWDLGLERAGMRVVWQCESDDFCRRVLAKHWPDVPCFHDVRDLSSAAGTPAVDVLCGGFPCQDISYAGAGAGITGARSGLWSEYARLIGDLRPRYVLVENVAALLARGLGVVLGDLAALGYDAEWDCIPASAIGAPHRRDRLWLVGYPNHESESALTVDDEASWLPSLVADASRNAETGVCAPSRTVWQRARAGSESGGARGVPDPDGQPVEWPAISWPQCGHWLAEPDVGRVAHGVPDRMDRLRSLGNALVPQIAEWLGRRIMTYEEAK